MHAANVNIISELKHFLFSVSNNKELLPFFRTQPKAFTRRRVLTFDRLVLFTIQLCKRTLEVELDDFFAGLGAKGCSLPAFCAQRMKLDPSFFYCWNQVLYRSFYKHYGDDIKRWRGYRLVGCDGSNMAMVNKPKLQACFGGQSNQSSSFVQAKTFYGYDVLNKMILFPSIVPYRYGEVQAAYDMLMHEPIEPDMLMIFDRNFSSYKIVALLTMREQPIRFVIRVKDSLNIAKYFIEQGHQQQVIELAPSLAAIKGLRRSGFIVSSKTGLKVRLIRVNLGDGKVEVLMTNLWESEGYATHEFKAIYANRWGIETNIGFQKNIMKLEALSGQTPISVLQDFYATIFTANLHSLLIKPAQNTLDQSPKERKFPLQVNNNKAFGRLKRVLVSLFLTQRPQLILEKLHGYFIRSPLPIRPGRSFPRIRQNPLSKTKHRMYTNYKPAF